MKFLNVYTVTSTILVFLFLILIFIDTSSTNYLAALCFGLFSFSLMPVGYTIKEVISWNNGICKETGKSWIQVPEFPDYGKSFESKDVNGTFKTNLKFYKPQYNHMSA